MANIDIQNNIIKIQDRLFDTNQFSIEEKKIIYEYLHAVDELIQYLDKNNKQLTSAIKSIDLKNE